MVQFCSRANSGNGCEAVHEGRLFVSTKADAIARRLRMQFVKQSIIRATPERVFEFHELPDVLALLTPSWEHARVVQPAHIVRWVAEHTVYNPPHFFEDIQLKGPFKSWRHRHIIEPHPDGSVLRDEIEYEPPLGFMGHLIAPVIIERRLEKLFNHRHDVTRRWCETMPQSDLKT